MDEHKTELWGCCEDENKRVGFMKTGSSKELSDWQLVKNDFAVFPFLLYVFYIDHSVSCIVVYELHTGIIHNGPCIHAPRGFEFIRIGIFCVQS
jgi:hypothetical protein